MTETVKLEKKGLDKIKILSGAQLKYIAFLSMLIDHTNKALIYPILKDNYSLISLDIVGCIRLYYTNSLYRGSFFHF